MLGYPRNYGKYILLERLGIGGMSEVDLARQKMGDRDFVRFVVIKRIKTDRSGDDAFIRMFKDEARITSELHHESIGQVYDFGREGEEYFLALEYVPGIDVRGVINALRERGQRVPIRVALRILCDTLDGLDYAHRKRDSFGRPMNIVHRDVNPRNVMVSIHGETKLIDFGVAKASGRLERTKTDHVKGKFSYMAPEQITGEAVDRRADLFAVGLTLHEFIAGYGPFFGLNQVQIVHRLLHGQIPAMPAVRDLPDDTQLRRVHDKALAPDPDKRYQTAQEFRRDLENVALQVGGLPTREQLARFLQKVDPGITERLQEKMRTYAAEMDVTQSGIAPRPVAIAHSDDVSGTIDHEAAPILPETGSTQYTVTSGTMVGMVGGAAIAAGVLVFALMSGLILLYLVVFGWGPAIPEPVPRSPTAPLTPPDQPAPVLDPGAVPVPVAPVPGPQRPDPGVPVAAPTPQPPEVDEVVPDVEVPLPEPEPVDPAPVQPGSHGTLQVNAPERGVPFKVDGVLRGKTPGSVKLPVGTYTVSIEGYPSMKRTIHAKQFTKAIFQ